jgi:xanthine/CO dehydrogenase XdhC/CoxF family maturation factor
MRVIYLDNNSTSPVLPDVLQAMLPCFTESFGNPSSIHGCGRRALAYVKVARQQVAALLGCLPAEVVFTTGGTEGDNLALKGMLSAGDHLIVSAIEHSAILSTCTLQVFVEPVMPAPRLYIFGAGHVGFAVYKVATLAGFEIIVTDDRDQYANRERFPDAHEIHTGEMDEIMSGLAPGDSSYIVIVTRGHRHDLRVLRWALETPAHYIGMIGSSRKVLAIYQQLEAEGVAPESFKPVFAPIGLDIQAATPEEIGISIVAELIAIRRGCELELPHSRNRIREDAEVKHEA